MPSRADHRARDLPCPEFARYARRNEGITRSHKEMHEEFIGTMPVQDKHRFDVERLDAIPARDTWRALRGPLEVAQFKGGQSNPTFLLTTPGKRYVLRRKPPGKLLPSAHAVDREYRVISALYRAGIPVARSLGAVRGRQRDRHRFLRHGLRRGPRVVGSGAAGHEPPRERAAHLRRDEPRHRRAAPGRLQRRSAWATTASRATTWSGRSAAGPSSTAPRRPRRSRRWRS